MSIKFLVINCPTSINMIVGHGSHAFHPSPSRQISYTWGINEIKGDQKNSRPSIKQL